MGADREGCRHQGGVTFGARDAEPSQSSKSRTGTVSDVQHSHHMGALVDRIDDPIHVGLLPKQEMTQHVVFGRYKTSLGMFVET